jgi:hypothetical protein
MNEIEFLFRIGSRSVQTRNNAAQLRPEIEVMTPASEQAILRNDITEGALANTGRADEQDRVNGESV